MVEKMVLEELPKQQLTGIAENIEPIIHDVIDESGFHAEFENLIEIGSQLKSRFKWLSLVQQNEIEAIYRVRDEAHKQLELGAKLFGQILVSWLASDEAGEFHGVTPAAETLIWLRGLDKREITKISEEITENVGSKVTDNAEHPMRSIDDELQPHHETFIAIGREISLRKYDSAEGEIQMLGSGMAGLVIKRLVEKQMETRETELKKLDDLISLT
jgi:hypothetical protein